jgi:hypothetical protein
MPLLLHTEHPSLVIRRASFERAGLTRQAIDERLGLTPDEFRVERDVIVIGPILDEDAMQALVADLESAGLAWFDDFFDMSGNWPAWLSLFAGSTPGAVA